MRTITEQIKQSLLLKLFRVPLKDRWLVKRKTVIYGELRIPANGKAVFEELNQYLVVELDNIPMFGLLPLNYLTKDGKQLYIQGVCRNGDVHDFKATVRSGDFMKFSPPKELAGAELVEFRVHSEIPILVRVFWRCTSNGKF